MLKVLVVSLFLTPFFSKLSYPQVSCSLFFLLWLISLLVPISPVGYFSGYFTIDGLSYILLMLTVLITVLGLLSSFEIVGKEKNGVFMFLVLILLIFLLLSFSLSNLLGFYVFFEASLIPLMVVVVGFGNQPEKMGAGLYMLFYTVFGSLPLLLGLLMLLKSSGTLIFSYLEVLGYQFDLVMVPLIFLAFLVKLPSYFVHLWLPKAHVEAPVYGSMILAGVMLKLGGYGMYRFLTLFISAFSGLMDLVVSFSLVGGVLASLICLTQGDLSSLVAYSSVGHMMMFMGGLFSLSWWGWFGGLVMMIAHGLTSSGMFSMINMIYERVHSRSMMLVRGVLMTSPILSMFWFLLSASNMAAPPFLNLVGELYLSFGLLGLDMMFSLPLGLMFFIGGAYSMYFFALTQHGGLWEVNGYYGVLTLRESFVLYAHILPLLLLILKLDLLY